jgi:plasmid stability protein
MSHVQVRDVPEDVLGALKARAAENGQSLQRFLLDLFAEEAAVATNAAVLDEAAADTASYPAVAGEAADLVRRGRQERDWAILEPGR